MNESCRFDGNASICDLSTISIFVDDLDNEKPVRTPRGGTRQPFGRSTKENIVTTPHAAKKSSGPASHSEDFEAKHAIALGNTSTCATPRRINFKACEKLVDELQKRVEELERSGRESQRTITVQLRRLSRLEAEKAEWKKCFPGCENELLLERLHRVEGENDCLRDQLEELSSREGILEAAATPIEEPEALAKLVAELVDRELSIPRTTLRLQRKAWERHAQLLQRQTEKVEHKLEQKSKAQQMCKQEALARTAAGLNAEPPSPGTLLVTELTTAEAAVAAEMLATNDSLAVCDDDECWCSTVPGVR